MACTITISLLTESQEGTIGNDWKYEVQAKVFSGALAGKGTIKVPKHRLDSGKPQSPPGPPEPLVLPAGEPGADIRVALRFKVAEVDLFKNDKGEMTASFNLTCPPPGGAALVEERDVSIGVEEEPSGIGHAVFKLAYRVTLQSD